MIDHVALADRGDAAIAAGQFAYSTNVGAITADDLAPYANAMLQWQLTAAYGRETSATRTTPNRVDDILRRPSNGPRSLALFFSWLRREGRPPFATTTTTEEPRMTLPLTSPRAAFDTEQQVLTAYHAWVASDDPRLPDLMTIGESTASFRRSLRDTGARRGRDHFDDEILEGYRHDTFVPARGQYLSQYAQGFWRDVRDLGWGTPAFEATPQPPAVFATVEQIRAYRRLTPELIEPWRKTFIRFVTEEKAAGGLTGMDDDWATDTRSGGDARDDGASTLNRMMDRPETMPGTSRYFADWLDRHGQTAPDPSEPTVPSGDTVIPIGPEHPGWADFWERARQAAGGPGGRYETYWQTLAREFGVLPARQRRVVHVVVPVTVDVEADATEEATIARAARQVDGYFASDRGASRVISSTPIRS